MKTRAITHEVELAQIRAKAATPSTSMGRSLMECAECGWIGPLSDTVRNGQAIVGCCPKCNGRQVVGYDPTNLFGDFSQAIPRKIAAIKAAGLEVPDFLAADTLDEGEGA